MECHKCGVYVDVPKIKKNGPHNAAYCPECSAFIKNLNPTEVRDFKKTAAAFSCGTMVNEDHQEATQGRLIISRLDTIIKILESQEIAAGRARR